VQTAETEQCGTISVINLAAGEKVDTIKVGEKISHGIEATAEGTKLLIGDEQEEVVKIYNPQSQEVAAQIGSK
jgi:DNA-binding beta-propeller fold protein YncE